MDNQVWSDLYGYEEVYLINKNGEIWSKLKKKLMRPFLTKNGYMRISLWTKDGYKKELVHRLVALTFIPNPENLPQVNHKDENKQNNSVENLEWCNQKYNSNYGTGISRQKETCMRNGVYDRAKERFSGELNPSKIHPLIGEQNGKAKKVICDGKVFGCIKDCAIYYGVNRGTMRDWLAGAYSMPEYFKAKNLRFLRD